MASAIQYGYTDWVSRKDRYINLEQYMLSMLFFLSCGNSESEIIDSIKEKRSTVSSKSTARTEEENVAMTIRQLSVYDGDIVCSKLTKQDRQSTLTYIVEHISLPPWAPMRAATCLAKLYPEEAQEDLVRWVENPETKGLAFLLTRQIKSMPEPVARRIALAGLNGPFSAEIRSRLVQINDSRIKDILPKSLEQNP